MQTEPVVIKQYGGKRLYDTRAARYVSLSDIAELVRTERGVRIYEAASGEDITASVLAGSWPDIIEHGRARLSNLTCVAPAAGRPPRT